MTERAEARLRRVQQQIAAIRKLHDDDLQLILDQLRELASDLEAQAPQAAAPPTAEASPKRAKWLAEQQKRSQLSRRDLLRGRDDPAP